LSEAKQKSRSEASRQKKRDILREASLRVFSFASLSQDFTGLNDFDI